MFRIIGNNQCIKTIDIVDQLIHIVSDSQAALIKLAFHQITLKIAWDHLENLGILAKHSKVTFLWVPGYKCILENESANKPGRKGFAAIFTRPEPSLVLTKSAIRGAVAE